MTNKADVVLLSAEDDLADTIRPRLESAGGDVARVHALQGIRCGDLERPFNLGTDIMQLEAALQKFPATKLVVIDPISAYMLGADSHKNTDVRSLLAPLAQLAAEYAVAMVLVSHLNKSSINKDVYRTCGSIAFPAAARMVWMVRKDPHDASRRFLLPTKSNLAAEPTGLGFRIIDGQVAYDHDPVDWQSEQSEAANRPPTSALTEATAWLTEALTPGPVEMKELQRLAEQDGISPTTLRRAKKKLCIRSAQEFIHNERKWFWYLPEPAMQGIE